jgi:glucan phosphoethanolaminetransferase (alkaline phosphatase superfamily)
MFDSEPPTGENNTYLLTGRLTLKLLFIISALSATAPYTLSRVLTLGFSPSLFVFLALLIFSVSALLALALIANSAARCLLALTSGVFTAMGTTFAYAAQSEWTYFDFITLVDARSASVDVSSMFFSAILTGAITGGAMFVGIALHPRFTPRLPQAVLFAFPGLFGVALAAMIFARNGDGVTGLPSTWSGTSFAALYAYDWTHGAAGERSLVAMKPKPYPGNQDIVLIVDESIAGHYLDLNATNGARSGLNLAGAEPNLIANFGLAAAITNCSMGANVTLRYGGGRADYQRKIATMPSIWSYARKAGYGTVHLYAQRGESLQNYMTNSERAEIDHIFRFEDVADIDRDQRVADVLSTLLLDGRKEFILVNKMGSHFPAHQLYPDRFGRFKPELPRGRSLRVGDLSLADRLSVIRRPSDWRLYINSYRNSVSWSVGAFFDRLFRNPIGGATIIYTSDHGQTFHERGNSGLLTHCESLPQIEEGIVPLVAIFGEGRDPSHLARAAMRNKDSMSAFRIFPSLLLMMGYPEPEVYNLYGPSLASSEIDPFTFAANMYLKLNRKPDWISIPRSEIKFPPR